MEKIVSEELKMKQDRQEYRKLLETEHRKLRGLTDGLGRLVGLRDLLWNPHKFDFSPK